MAQPWQTMDKVDTPDGVLELRKRGERDYLILINNRVLMNSSANRSELALGELAAKAVAKLPLPRVLIGGLGMGLTLRATLDKLPDTAEVTVVELNSVIVKWCQEFLGGLTNNAVRDPRVSIKIQDVASAISYASQPKGKQFDAIIIDLYEGPGASTDVLLDPFYSSRALKRTVDALTLNGVFAVWGEAPDVGFEKRLAAAGFAFERKRPGKGGMRHVVYVARKRA